MGGGVFDKNRCANTGMVLAAAHADIPGVHAKVVGWSWLLWTICCNWVMLNGPCCAPLMAK